MKKKISILVLAIIAATGCAHQDNYRDDNSDVAYSESDSSSDYNMEKDNSSETNSSNDDSNGTIINETTKYTYTAYGDEYCTVSLRNTGEELCTITKNEYEQDFTKGKVEEYDNILGYEGFVVSVPFGDHYLIDVYCNTDGGYECIEHSYVSDYFVEDIDGNDVFELILNVVFMADGRSGVFVDRNYDNTFQCARVNMDYGEPNHYGERYDSETKMISIFYYRTSSDSFDEVTIPIEEAYQDNNILNFEDME
jgi:hypothetical protein